MDLDHTALAAAEHLYHSDALRPLELRDGLTAFVSEHAVTLTTLENAEPGVRIYGEAVIELRRLAEEIRFEAALAVALLVDYRVKHEPEDSVSVEEAMPIPIEVTALLGGYMRDPPGPWDVFVDPHVEIAGGRVLSRWFAAQLLDSALYRAIAASDRLAVLLQARAAVPFTTTKVGEPRFPTFTPADLRKLNDHYRAHPEWTELRALAANPLFTFVREARNQFTHGRRIASELHGDRLVSYISTGQDVVGLDAGEHVALVLAVFDAILRPAVSLTAYLVGPAQTPTSVA